MDHLAIELTTMLTGGLSRAGVQDLLYTGQLLVHGVVSPDLVVQ